MVDMAQADRTMYWQPQSDSHAIDWLWALKLAANQRGYAHYTDVPDELLDSIKSDARHLQGKA
jgi:hypothetical protein